MFIIIIINVFVWHSNRLQNLSEESHHFLSVNISSLKPSVVVQFFG